MAKENHKHDTLFVTTVQSINCQPLIPSSHILNIDLNNSSVWMFSENVCVEKLDSVLTSRDGGLWRDRVMRTQLSWRSLWTLQKSWRESTRISLALSVFLHMSCYSSFFFTVPSSMSVQRVRFPPGKRHGTQHSLNKSCLAFSTSENVNNKIIPAVSCCI